MKVLDSLDELLVEVERRRGGVEVEVACARNSGSMRRGQLGSLNHEKEERG